MSLFLILNLNSNCGHILIPRSGIQDHSLKQINPYFFQKIPLKVCIHTIQCPTILGIIPFQLLNPQTLKVFYFKIHPRVWLQNKVVMHYRSTKIQEQCVLCQTIDEQTDGHTDVLTTSFCKLASSFSIKDIKR